MNHHSPYRPKPGQALVLAASLLVAGCAAPPTESPAPATPAPPSNAEAPADAPVVFFYGDSISTGHGFRTGDHPSPLNGIHGIANILLDANCASGAEVRTDLGQDFNVLYYEAARDQFDSGDFVLWTNAGPTVNDAEMYRKWLELQLFATQGKAPLILTTTYDHGGFTSYSEPLASGGSLNDVVRQFARDNGTLLLDWHSVMAAAAKRVQPFGGSLLTDGIHPGVFGNFVMAAALLRYLGVPVRDLDTLPRLYTQEAGDVPDMTEALFHWGYNPSRVQRIQMLDGFLEDVETTIQPGPEALDCN